MKYEGKIILCLAYREKTTYEGSEGIFWNVEIKIRIVLKPAGIIWSDHMIDVEKYDLKNTWQTRDRKQFPQYDKGFP